MHLKVMQTLFPYRNSLRHCRQENVSKHLGLRIGKGGKMLTEFWWKNLLQNSYLDGRKRKHKYNSKISDSHVVIKIG